MTPQKLLAPLFILFIGSTVAISNETCSKETPKMPTLAKQNHVLPLKLPGMHSYISCRYAYIMI